jgi:hypothetical protein
VERDVERLARKVDEVLERIIAQQRAKVLAVARQRVPHVTCEDIMTPEGYPELWADGPFNYEDGILNGLRTAQMAVRAWAREQTEAGEASGQTGGRARPPRP